jgi:hypothetical protein
MRYLSLSALPFVFMLFTSNAFVNTDLTPELSAPEKTGNNILTFAFQQQPSSSRMATVIFKNQDYCRVELEDFEFDYKFTVVSADVYFSGKNFEPVTKANITSNSLKPLKSIMSRCTAGTVVTFDNVKVKGPDNSIRTIDGLSLLLY